MSEYDEEAVEGFGTVREAIAALRLPLMQNRRYGCITNAIEVQIEEGHANKEVLRHLRGAIIALLRADGLLQHTKAVEQAFDEFERKIASRLK